MKKIYTLSFAILFALGFFNAQAQIYTPSGITPPNTGGNNIGIGTDSPDAKLHVKDLEDDLLLIESEYAATIENTWVFAENAFRIIGPGFQQGIPPSLPGLATTFSIAPSGHTRIGDFPQTPNTMLSVRNSMGVYSSTNRWMQFKFPSNLPTLAWKSGGSASFRIQNEATGNSTLWITPNGKVGIGNDFVGNEFVGDHSLYVSGGAVVDRTLDIQKQNQWGEQDEFVRLRYNTWPHLSWESSENLNFTFTGNGNNVMQLSPEGKVGIGTSHFVGNHSLYVKGSAVAEEIFVLLKNDWGDFVFEKDYDLMPLNVLENYLDKNKHLPDFPSAAEVKEEGLALGETERLLTIKVEELTLYLLQMNKEMEALREEITTLRGEK